MAEEKHIVIMLDVDLFEFVIQIVKSVCESGCGATDCNHVGCGLEGGNQCAVSISQLHLVSVSVCSSHDILPCFVVYTSLCSEDRGCSRSSSVITSGTPYRNPLSLRKPSHTLQKPSHTLRKPWLTETLPHLTETLPHLTETLSHRMETLSHRTETLPHLTETSLLPRYLCTDVSFVCF